MKKNQDKAQADIMRPIITISRSYTDYLSSIKVSTSQSRSLDCYSFQKVYTPLNSDSPSSYNLWTVIPLNSDTPSSDIIKMHTAPSRKANPAYRTLKKGQTMSLSQNKDTARNHPLKNTISFHIISNSQMIKVIHWIKGQVLK